MIKFFNKPNLSPTISTVIRTNIRNHKSHLSTTTFGVNQYILRHNCLASFSTKIHLNQNINNNPIKINPVFPLYSATTRNFTANTANNTKKAENAKGSSADRVGNWIITACIGGVIIVNLIVLWRHKRIEYLNNKLLNMKEPIYDPERLKLQLELIIRYLNMGQDENAVYVIAELVTKVDPKYLDPILYKQFDTIISYNAMGKIKPLLGYYIQARKLTEPTAQTLQFIWDLEDKAERMNKFWLWSAGHYGEVLANCMHMKCILSDYGPGSMVHFVKLAHYFVTIDGNIYLGAQYYEAAKKELKKFEELGLIFNIDNRIILEIQQLQEAIVEADKKLQKKLDKFDDNEMNKMKYKNLLINFILFYQAICNILM